MNRGSLQTAGIVAWLAILVFWLAWTPFFLSDSPGELALRPPSDPVEILLNLVLMVPVGLVVGFSRSDGDGRCATSGSIYLAVAFVAAGVSLAAESGQLFFIGRHPSPYDIGLNVTGALVGGRAALYLRRLGLPARLGTGLTMSHLYLAMLVYLLAMGSLLSGGHRLQAWDGSYAIAAGEETDGARQYLGSVSDAEICAGSGDTGLCAGPGAPPAIRRRIAARAEQTQRVSLQAVVVARSAAQEGPARIVTFSDGILYRNATLGQSGRDLVLRLRTPLAGSNGAQVMFRLPKAVPVGTRIPVSASYDRGRVTLRAGSGRDARIRSSSYPLLLWTKVLTWKVEEHRDSQVWIATLIGLLAVFLPVRLGLGTMVRLNLPASLAVTVILAGSIYALLLLRLSLPFQAPWLLAVLAASLLGGSMGARLKES